VGGWPRSESREIDYVFVPQKNSGQNHNSIIANKYFENAEKFIYLGTTVTKTALIKK
jgi:hypothetical protein